MLDKTKEYYIEYFELEEEEKKKYSTELNKYITNLEVELKNAWGSKDKDKIANISEIIEEYRAKADEDQKVILDNIQESWDYIYKGTWRAWEDDFTLASDDIAYYLSQSTAWVTRELKDRLDYIQLIKPQIFFSLNYMLSAVEQQYFCRKKHLYNISSFESLLSESLKEVNSYITLDIDDSNFSEAEKSRLLKVLNEIEENASIESNISNKTVQMIMNKEIELLNISAIKELYLKEQLELNIERMCKKLYLGVEVGIINKDRKLYEEEKIKMYEKKELNRIKNTTTVYNTQVYRYLDSTPHKKFHLYFNENKKPLVLYSFDVINSKEGKYKIPKSAYYEGIEEVILQKVKTKTSDVIDIER